MPVREDTYPEPLALEVGWSVPSPFPSSISSIQDRQRRVTHFSQFVAVNVEKIVRKSTTQFWEKLTKIEALAKMMVFL